MSLCTKIGTTHAVYWVSMCESDNSCRAWMTKILKRACKYDESGGGKQKQPHSLTLAPQRPAFTLFRVPSSGNSNTCAVASFHRSDLCNCSVDSLCTPARLKSATRSSNNALARSLIFVAQQITKFLVGYFPTKSGLIRVASSLKYLRSKRVLFSDPPPWR